MAMHRELDLGRGEARRQLRRGRRQIVETKNLAAVVADEVRMRAMRRVGARGGRETEHALFVGDLVRKPLLDQPVEHAVKRDAVDRRAVGKRLFDIVMREPTEGRAQQRQHAQARRRDACAALAQQA